MRTVIALELTSKAFLVPRTLHLPVDGRQFSFMDVSGTGTPVAATRVNRRRAKSSGKRSSSRTSSAIFARKKSSKNWVGRRTLYGNVRPAIRSGLSQIYARFSAPRASVIAHLITDESTYRLRYSKSRNPAAFAVTVTLLGFTGKFTVALSLRTGLTLSRCTQAAQITDGRAGSPASSAVLPASPSTRLTGGPHDPTPVAAAVRRRAAGAGRNLPPGGEAVARPGAHCLA